MRKMSPSSWEKERAMVLRRARSKVSAWRRIKQAVQQRACSKHVRLGTTAIGLPVAVELGVGHGHVGFSVSSACWCWLGESERSGKGGLSMRQQKSVLTVAWRDCRYGSGEMGRKRGERERDGGAEARRGEAMRGKEGLRGRKRARAARQLRQVTW